MSAFKSDFLTVMHERGYVHQVTDLDALDAACAAGSITAYAGFDCTGPSLHVGHMISIMLLRRLQQAGHKPIVLLGGGTTRVGDPSGKDESRKLLTPETIADNKASIFRAFDKCLTFGDGPTDAVLVDNADWLLGIKYVDFLRDIGRHFTINRMLTFDSVKLRLDREQPLTFLEFNYMLLQAYDFVELNKRYGCSLQMGGSDQWGNIINGVELGRRSENASLYGLTTPLLTTASGAKMGKTADGAVWLNDDMLPPYEFWQFWRNTEDADVGRFLKLFTDLPMDEIARLEALEGAQINEAKIRLANEVTTLLHGADAARSAEETARKVFAEGAAGNDLPVVEVAAGASPAWIDMLVEAGLCSSKGDARRQIRQNAVKVDGAAMNDEAGTVPAAPGEYRLSKGKKNHALIKVG